MATKETNRVLVTEQELGGYCVEWNPNHMTVPMQAACSSLDEALDVAKDLLKAGGPK